MSTLERTRRTLCLSLAVLVVTGVAACGSDDSGSSDTADASGQAAAKNGPAEKLVAQYTKAQPPISIPPLGGDPPKGKTLGMIECQLPVCQAVANQAAEAAKRLGWKTRRLQWDFSPESYIGVWNQMLQDPPDAIFLEPLTPNATIKSQLAKVKQLGIPMVGIAPAGDRPDDVMRASYNGAPEFAQSGKLMGAVVAADSDEAKTAFVWDKSLAPIWQPVRDEYTKMVEADGGSVDVLSVQSAETGKGIPTQVVSYLQRKPDIKYLAFSLNDLTAGVPQAIKSAGLDVKIVSRAPQPGNIKEIQDGMLFASVGEEDASNGWRAIDGLLRLMLDKPLGECCTEPAGWAQIYTKDSLPAGGRSVTPGMPDAFLKAWGLGT